jgi:hypothetical protein
MNFGERFDTEVFDPCRQSADCPADQVCIPFFVDPPRSVCFPVCGPPS